MGDLNDLIVNLLSPTNSKRFIQVELNWNFRTGCRNDYKTVDFTCRVSDKLWTGQIRTIGQIMDQR